MYLTVIFKDLTSTEYLGHIQNLLVPEVHETVLYMQLATRRTFLIRQVIGT